MENINQFTVQDTVDWCLQRDLDPAKVRFTGGHLQYESPQTDREAEYAATWERQAAERRERWERETYDRLRAKFEA